VYVGAQVDFPVGISKKVDDKYYNQASKAVISSGTNAVTPLSLSALKNDLYIKRPFGVRYALSVGYKF
jgi:hypothetical protein